MKYKVVEKVYPGNPDASKKQYANPVNAGRITIRDFARKIAGRSSLTRGDIENVLSNVFDGLPTFLKLGMSVEPGQKFDASKIKGVKLIFTPGSELKKSLADTTATMQL